MIIILGTMEEEISYFRKNLTRDDIIIESIKQWGKVAAAAKAQQIIDKYNPQKIILVGTAGAINPDLHQGDVISISGTYQHDINIPSEILDRFPGSTELAEPRINTPGDKWCATGDAFIDYRAGIDADCVDMEADAFAQVCEMNDTDYMIFKCISDNADGSASQDFTQFLPSASKKLYDEVIKWM